MTRSRWRGELRGRGSWGEEGSRGGIGECAVKLRNSKVKLRWVGGGGGWYERIAVILCVCPQFLFCLWI